MEELLKNLLVGLEMHLDGNMSLNEIEDNLTSPIISDESNGSVPNAINDLVYRLDMWEIENLSRDDIANMKNELQTYLQTNQLQ